MVEQSLPLPLKHHHYMSIWDMIVNNIIFQYKSLQFPSKKASESFNDFFEKQLGDFQGNKIVNCRNYTRFQ